MAGAYPGAATTKASVLSDGSPSCLSDPWAIRTGAAGAALRQKNKNIISPIVLCSYSFGREHYTANKLINGLQVGLSCYWSTTSNGAVYIYTVPMLEK